jgi:hypothetical protein
MLEESMPGNRFCTVTPVLRACELDRPPVWEGHRSVTIAEPMDEGPRTSAPEPSGDRVAALRGAGVSEVDVRRLSRVALAVVAVVLVVLAVLLFVAGAHKNSQVTTLQNHGVPVTATVTGCLGQLGGSGSNAAGFTCRGRYHLAGREYDEVIPGNTAYPPGTHLRVVVAHTDPALVSTPHLLATEHPSAGVYVAPTVLLVVAVGLGLVLILGRRRRHPAPAGDPAPVSPPMSRSSSLARP